ncbi:zinc finger protein [Macleaya cordata]|uniref:Zinc finger protein n=1 Tax=Macleaya cordata TaxID=56857 RepID=A0A200QNZ9_MACCD|nr:zinc finger protein [Macleaya cordata]
MLGFELLTALFKRVKSKSYWFWQVLHNIAKTGSFCCVAARPHGSNAASREWSMGPNEPYWRTNTSFSPPLSSRWDQSFQTEGIPNVSHGALQLYGSSLSSNSKESRTLMRGDHFRNHSASDGAGSYFSSPSDSFQTQQWTPPTKGFNIDDSGSGAMRVKFLFVCFQGTSAFPYSAGSTSSRSDGSEYEPMAKTHASSNRNFSSRCSFMSKPIHPISFSNQGRERDSHLTIATGSSFNQPIPNDNSTRNSDLKSVRNLAELQPISGFSEVGSSTQRETLRWSSASSSMDFTDVSEQLDTESVGPSYDNISEGFRCGLCERFLSQRSPWSSRRIVRNGDMPVTGVLSCCHVFHADCLEQTTPKMQKQDPPCPLCSRSEENNSVEQPLVSRLRNGLPRLRQFGEDGPSSKPWGCGQVGDCVEGALHIPSE